MKFVVLAIFAMFAMANALTVLQGQYSWFSSSSCSSPSAMNLTFTGQNQFQTGRSDNGKQALVNVTMNSDGQTFTGLGALYDPNTHKFSGYTTIKGQFSNQYNFVAVYNPSNNPYYQGSTEYYNLVSCFRTMSAEEEEYEMNFQKDFVQAEL